MKTINLEEILDEHLKMMLTKNNGYKELSDLKELPEYEVVLMAMREACNQCFDLADEESLKVKDDVYDSSVILKLKERVI